ncbi:MAG TPA: hypothetical protein VHY35_22535 [Stellaceae bacterium]|nr:hypothetical protein [Stellaceae bacterium]
MKNAGTSSAARGTTPPYVSYPSFKTLISEFHDHDIPTRIDRSVLTRFSGAVGSQLLTALRFLDLINDKSEPTERLKVLASAYGTGDWAQTLLPILREEYAAMFNLDLGAATSSHFTETFRKAFPGSEAVSQKCIAFFLGAVRDTGIAISERVLKGRKPRAGTSAPQRRRSANGAKPTQDSDAGASGSPADTNDGARLPLDSLLVEILRRIPSKDAGWPREQRLRWLRAFAMNISEIYDDPKSPVDFKIELAADNEVSAV